jgi:hypothetical protein
MNFIRSKMGLLIGAIALVAVFVAADHIDAPAVAGGSSDITDLYAFESPENASNLVFVCNLQGLLDPTATAGASFDPELMVEFNIDNDGDNREDLVIQCLYINDELVVYGPAAPKGMGTASMVNTAGGVVRTPITGYQKSINVGEGNGMKIFAGPRDDPFFFDFNQYSAILGGMASGFNNPGNDTFAGTNVMSTVVEVPKSMLGGSGTLNVWVETKRSKS